MSVVKEVYVSSTGLISAVGGDTELTGLAVNVGFSAVRETSILNKQINPIKMALVPDGAIDTLVDEVSSAQYLCHRQKRMLQLAAPAINEVMEGKEGDEPVPLFLALPEHLFDFEMNIKVIFLDWLIAQSGINIDRDNSRLIPYGRAAGIHAIDLAFKFLEAGLGENVLVGGVDTFLDAGLLAYLDSEDRVSAVNVKDGFIPGEGAAFALLTNKNNSGKKLGKIYLPGLAEETGHRYSSDPHIGSGLAQAFKSAILHSDGKKIEIIYSSMNGESINAKEYGVALIRNSAHISDNVMLEHPADCYGDIGAASGIAMLCLDHLRRKNGDWRKSLIYCSSDLAPRGALCIS